jgi:hypothetical protein
LGLLLPGRQKMLKLEKQQFLSDGVIFPAYQSGTFRREPFRADDTESESPWFFSRRTSGVELTPSTGEATSALNGAGLEGWESVFFDFGVLACR